ncbi:PEP-CTERM sorting domain-containing protein [Methylobacillus glycogenes]
MVNQYLVLVLDEHIEINALYKLSAVPEPSTYAPLALGLGLVTLPARR